MRRTIPICRLLLHCLARQAPKAELTAFATNITEPPAAASAVSADPMGIVALATPRHVASNFSSEASGGGARPSATSLSWQPEYCSWQGSHCEPHMSFTSLRPSSQLCLMCRISCVAAQ